MGDLSQDELFLSSMSSRRGPSNILFYKYERRFIYITTKITFNPITHGGGGYYSPPAL